MLHIGFIWIPWSSFSLALTVDFRWANGPTTPRFSSVCPPPAASGDAFTCDRLRSTEKCPFWTWTEVILRTPVHLGFHFLCVISTCFYRIGQIVCAEVVNVLVGGEKNPHENKVKTHLHHLSATFTPNISVCYRPNSSVELVLFCPRASGSMHP